MEYTNDNKEKICNFYMSDWHFTLMLLPYINKEINMNTHVTTFLEKNMTENIKTLVEKLNLKNKEEILKINWNKTDINNVTKNIEDKIMKGENILIIINGTNSYIQEVNSKIDDLICTNYFSNKKIKIIDCYDFDSNKENIGTIVKNYDVMLNTSGVKKIESIL